MRHPPCKSPKTNYLALAEGVANRKSDLRHIIVRKLIRQVRDVVEIELRLKEKIPTEVKFDAGSSMYLKVIGANPGWRAGVAANAACNTSSLIDV